MPDKVVRFTREQLYDLVWSRPMTSIAAEFGMSSVAFAKYCKAAEVPRPERGYWQQIACGEKPARPKLPKPTVKASENVSIAKYQRASIGKKAPPPDIPRVEVAERVHKLHPAVRELDGLLRPDCRHNLMLAVRGTHQVVVKVAKETRTRAMRLLHALLRTIEEHGHQARLSVATESSRWERGTYALEIVVDGEPTTVSLREHSNQNLREKGERESSLIFDRKYDLVPSGCLILDLRIPWHTGTRTHWRDSDEQTLEDLLGAVVWTVDEAARSLVVHRAHVAEQAREAEAARKLADERELERKRRAAEEKRRLADAEARAHHERTLKRDVRHMARRWSSAREIREFLNAVEHAVPVPDRGEGFRRWLAWASDYAEHLDPINAPMEIAKDLKPTPPVGRAKP